MKQNTLITTIILALAFSNAQACDNVKLGKFVYPPLGGCTEKGLTMFGAVNCSPCSFLQVQYSDKKVPNTCTGYTYVNITTQPYTASIIAGDCNKTFTDIPIPGATVTEAACQCSMGTAVIGTTPHGNRDVSSVGDPCSAG